MRFAVLALGLLLAQDFESSLKLKLESEFLKKNRWILDLDAAKAEAAKTGRKIFVHFTRSDAKSPACDAVEGGLYRQPAFAEWAKGHVLFCHVLTRIKSRRHDALLAEKGGGAIPQAAFLDAEGNLLVFPESPASLDVLRSLETRADEFLALRKKVEAGDAGVKLDLFIRATELGHWSAEDARRRAGDYGDLAPRVVRAITTRETIEIIASVDANQPATMRDAGRKFAAMHKEGRLPSDVALQPFYILILDFAEAEKNVPLFDEGLAVLKARFGNEPGAHVFFAEKEETRRRLGK